jgi:hypothetical protein
LIPQAGVALAAYADPKVDGIHDFPKMKDISMNIAARTDSAIPADDPKRTLTIADSAGCAISPSSAGHIPSF